MSGNAPSPWSWSDEYRTIDGRPTWSLVASDGYGILSCDGEENSPQGVNEPVLARLIASAPRLLETLQSIVDDYEFCKAHPAWGDRGESYAESARLAIAAATGETK